MAFDYGAVRLIYFTYNYSSSNEETWNWNGTNWSMYSPATRPEWRYTYAMAETHPGVVLVGASWQTYYGTSGVWQWLSGAWSGFFSYNRLAGLPAERLDHAIVTDTTRGKIVAFGGKEVGCNEMDDTWECSGTSWTLRQQGIAHFDSSHNVAYDLTPTSPSPDPRGGHKIAYDNARSRVVLYGGESVRTGSTLRFHDTWELPSYTPTVNAVFSPATPHVGDTVTLTATYTNTDHQSFAWLQTSGPRVSLSAPSATVTTFAPQSAGVYVFDGVSTNGKDAQGWANGMVQVSP